MLPRLLHELQYPSVTSKTIRDCNRAFRQCIKHILLLPSSTTSHFFYAKCRDGGLGVQDLEHAIPIIFFNRINRLREENDAILNATLETKNVRFTIAKLCRMMGTYTDATFVRQFRQDGLENSYSGGGLVQGNHHSASRSWVYNPPPYWTARDYIRAIKLRANMLPTHGLPYVPAEMRRCRRGCDRVQSLSHVLQKCPTTHYSRINRHNGIVQLLKNIALKKSYQAIVEPCIMVSCDERKCPNLILITEEEIIISDVAVAWEATSLSEHYLGKIKKYSTTTFLYQVKRKYGPDKAITVAPFIVGARGIICQQNDTLVAKIGISDANLRTIVTDTMKGSWTSHADFIRSS